MKKISVVLMVIMGLFIFAGCGGSSDSSETATQTEGEAIEKIIPNPDKYFKNATINTQVSDTGRAYELVGTITKDEYLTYLEACKDKGFTVIKLEDSDDTEGQYYYTAYSEDKKYSLSLDCYTGDKDYNSYIICQENSDNQEESSTDE